MIEIKDIENGDALEAWLKDKPKDWSVAIAARAAMRVLPVWWWSSLKEDAGNREVMTLRLLRSLITSSIAAKLPTENMRAASDSVILSGYVVAAVADPTDAASVAASAKINTDAAVSYADAKVGVAATAAASADAPAAADAAASAIDATAYFDTSASAWSALGEDCRALEAGSDVMRGPLWGEAPNPLREEWADIKAKAGADWAFWTAWYDGELKGAPLPDALILDIAKIDPEDWGKGPEHVNPIINEMWSGFSDAADTDRDGLSNLPAMEPLERALERNAKAVQQ